MSVPVTLRIVSVRIPVKKYDIKYDRLLIDLFSYSAIIF